LRENRFRYGIANLLARDERPEPVNYRARFQAAERAFEQFVLSGAQTDGFQKRFDRRLQQLRDSLDVQYRLVSAVFHRSEIPFASFSEISTACTSPFCQMLAGRASRIRPVPALGSST
jgi:hypothetical protein